jgi:hypothetical protein
MSPGSSFDSRRRSQQREDAFSDPANHPGTRTVRSGAPEDVLTSATQSFGQPVRRRRARTEDAPSEALATRKPSSIAKEAAVDEQTGQLIEQLNRRVEALERKSDDRSTTGSAPAHAEPLERAMAKLSSYDDLIRQAEGREKADLQRWRVKAAAEVLRSAVTVVDGHVPDDIADPLSEIEAACDRDPALPSWLDPDSFVGMAVVVGMAVLVATGAAPLGAAVVGESMLKETIKTAITTLVAGALMEAGNHRLRAMKEGRLVPADDQRSQPKPAE